MVWISYRIEKKPSYRIDMVSSRKKAYHSGVILILPKITHYIEGAPQNARTGVGYASHRGVVIHKSYNPAKNITKQLRTSENS